MRALGVRGLNVNEHTENNSLPTVRPMPLTLVRSGPFLFPTLRPSGTLPAAGRPPSALLNLCLGATDGGDKHQISRRLSRERALNMRRLGLYVLLATASVLAACESSRFTPGTQSDGALECRQMQQKLTDQTLTPAQTAEITRNMERAGCASKLRGP